MDPEVAGNRRWEESYLPRCLEIRMQGKATAISTISDQQEWGPIRRSAARIELVDELPAWKKWSGIYRVEPASGPNQHYIVAHD